MEDSSYLKREYWCFISYRHADNKEPGRQWATWLHQALENYEVPTELAGTKNELGDLVPERIFPVFRDEEELPTNAELSKPIESALSRSRFMVVLCSPSAVQSKYVAREILRFKQLGKSGRILAAIIDGEPNASNDAGEAGAAKECFPIPLRFRVGEDGQLTEEETEPVAADFRLSDGQRGWTTPGAYQEALRSSGLTEKQIQEKVRGYARRQNLMLLKVVAGVLGIPLGLLTRRDKAYQLEKQRRQAQVLRRWLALVGTIGVAAVIAGGIAYVNGVEASVQRDEAEVQRVEVTRQRDQQETLLWKASRADEGAATTAFEARDPSRGLAYLERAMDYRPMNSSALSASAVQAHAIAGGRWPTRMFSFFEGHAISLAFSSDGKLLAAGTGDEDRDQHQVRVINTETGDAIAEIDVSASVEALEFSRDDRCVIAASGGSARGKGEILSIKSDTGLAIWKVESGQPVTSLDLSPDGKLVVAGLGSIRGGAGELRLLGVENGAMLKSMNFRAALGVARFSPDGKTLACGGSDNSVSLIDLETWTLKARVEFGDKVSAVAFSPDSRYLLAGSWDNTAQMLSVADGKAIHLKKLPSKVQDAAFSPDGTRFAVGVGDYVGQGGLLKVYETETGDEKGEARVVSAMIKVKFSPDGRHIIGASGNVVSGQGEALVYETETANLVSKTRFGGMVKSVAFSPDGRFFAGASWDRTVRLMEPPLCSVTHLIDFEASISALGFSPDSSYLATGSDGGQVSVFHAGSESPVLEQTLKDSVWTVGFSPDSRQLVVGSGNSEGGRGEVHRIEVASNKSLVSPAFSEAVWSATFSPDGLSYAAGTGNVQGGKGEACVVETQTGATVLKVASSHTVWAAKFSPDGRHLAIGTGNFQGMGGEFQVIEIATQKLKLKKEFHNLLWAVEFSPDGKLVAVVSQDRKLHVFQADTGDELFSLRFKGYPWSVSFSADGLLVAVGTGSDNGGESEFHVIELATGKTVQSFVQAGRVKAVSFSRDGTRLALGGDDGTARVMDPRWFRPQEAASETWRAFVQLQSGSRFQDGGTLRALSPEEMRLSTDRVRTFTHSESDAKEQWQHAVVKWATLLPEKRTTSPWTKEPVRTAVGRWLMNARSAATITLCSDNAPWHPLAPLSLARMEPKPDANAEAPSREALHLRPGYLARLTLARLLAADEALYGREVLSDYAAWSAMTMHNELGLDAEASQAITFALDRAPAEKRESILELKKGFRSQ